jgi:hypothetical protein
MLLAAQRGSNPLLPARRASGGGGVAHKRKAKTSKAHGREYLGQYERSDRTLVSESGGWFMYLVLRGQRKEKRQRQRDQAIIMCSSPYMPSLHGCLVRIFMISVFCSRCALLCYLSCHYALYASCSGVVLCSRRAYGLSVHRSTLRK